MYICLYGSKRVGLSICLRRVIVSLMSPYSCLQLSICSSYAKEGSLFLMYRMCSQNFDFKLRLVWPSQSLWQALHLILYISLFSCSCNQVGVWVLWQVQWCCTLNDMPMFVFLNKLVIFLIFGLWMVNVVQSFCHFSNLFLLLLTLCSICRLSFSGRCCGKLLFLTIDCNIFYSVCFLSGSRGKNAFWLCGI
jgi:hypothetical protein